MFCLVGFGGEVELDGEVEILGTCEAVVYAAIW